MKTETITAAINDQYLYSYPSMICLIWKNKNIIGYTHTYNEADAICNENPALVWDFNINEKNGIKTAVLSNEELRKIPFITIHDTFQNS